MKNTGAKAHTVRVAGYADVMIDNNDRAPICATEDGGNTLLMTGAPQNDYAFRLVATTCDTVWYGLWSMRIKECFTDLENRGPDYVYSRDSGLAYFWTATVRPGEEWSRYVLIGTGSEEQMTVEIPQIPVPAPGIPEAEITLNTGEVCLTEGDALPDWNSYIAALQGTLRITGQPADSSTPGSSTPRQQHRSLYGHQRRYGKNGALTAAAGGLTEGILYYARAYAKAADGTVVYGPQSKGFGLNTPNYGVFRVTNSGKNVFTIERTGGTDGAQTVYYRTVNGSAVGGTHFTHAAGSVTFAKGESKKTVTVTEKAVTAAFQKAGAAYPATAYSNGDRTYQMEIYRVDGGAIIDGNGNRATRTMAKSTNYTIDRALYSTEQSRVNIAKTASGENGAKIADTTTSQGGSTQKIHFLLNRDNKENYHTSSNLSSYFSGNTLSYLQNTCTNWLYRYEMYAYEQEDCYEHAYMGSKLAAKQHYDLSGKDKAVSGIDGQLWARNFLQPEGQTHKQYCFPDQRTGGKEGSGYPLDANGSTTEINGKRYVTPGVKDPCYLYFSATGASEDIWWINGLTSYALPYDNVEPQLLAIAPMAGGTWYLHARATNSDGVTATAYRSVTIPSSGGSYSAMTNGLYTFTLTFNGETVTRQAAVSKLDTMAPAITVSQLPGDAYAEQVTLEISVTDGGSGVKTVTAKWGETPAVLTDHGDGAYSATCPNAAGAYKLTVTAADNVGNSASVESKTYIVDLKKPILTVRETSSGTAGETYAYTVNANGNRDVTVRLPDGTETSALTGSFTLAEPETYLVIVTDAAGHFVSQEITVSAAVDGVAPDVRLYADDTVDLPVLTAAAAIYEAGSAPTVRLDGAALTVADQGDGLYTGSFPVTRGGCYTVVASDRAGNTGRDSITVYGLVDGDRTVLKVAENGVYGALPVLTAEGYRFDGWYTAAEGGVEVKTGAEIGSNYTVYARWTHIAHAGGTATCQKRAVCAVCGAEYGDLSGHAPAAQWSKDESGHWHACQTEDCTEKCDFAAHLPDHPGGATEEFAVLCTVCGYVIQPQLTHTHIFDQEKAEEAEGVRQRSCQNDPQHIDQQSIPKLPARPVGPKPAEKPQETPGSGFVDVTGGELFPGSRGLGREKRHHHRRGRRAFCAGRHLHPRTGGHLPLAGRRMPGAANGGYALCRCDAGGLLLPRGALGGGTWGHQGHRRNRLQPGRRLHPGRDRDLHLAEQRLRRMSRRRSENGSYIFAGPVIK